MSALQKAFSRREKIAHMISALDKMKAQGEIAEDGYIEFKEKYDGLLNEALANLTEIRSKLKEQRNRIQADIEELSKEAKLVEVRGKTGELGPEQVSKVLTAIYAKRSDLQQHLTRYETQLEARSSVDLGGAVEVDIHEKIEFQSDKWLDGQKLDAFLGDLRDKVKTLKGSEMGQSLTKAATRIREKAADVQKRPLKKRFPVYIVVAVFAIIFLVAALSLFLGGDDSKELTKGIIERSIWKNWEKESPFYPLVVSGEAIIKELEMAGLVIANGPNMEKFVVNSSMENLVTLTNSAENNPFTQYDRLTLHMAVPDRLEIVRFTPPNAASGITTSLVEYRYYWKPTELLTNPKYQQLRDIIRKDLVEVESKIKLPVSAKAILSLFSDGWSIMESTE